MALELEYPEYATDTFPCVIVYVDPCFAPVYRTDVDESVVADPLTVNASGAVPFPLTDEGTVHVTFPDPCVQPAATKNKVSVPSWLSTNRVAAVPTVTVGFGVAYDTALPRDTVYPR